MRLLLLLIPLWINKEHKIYKCPAAKGILEWNVTLTTYTIKECQTDSTPLITADNSKLDSVNPRKHKIIAVSRDLKKFFKFGSKVKIINAGRFNGIYYVRDLMNKRFHNKIDILINPTDKQDKLENVLLIKI